MRFLARDARFELEKKDSKLPLGVRKERLWVPTEQRDEGGPAGGVKSGQVKRFQGTEEESRAAVPSYESGGFVLCECQVGTCHNRRY